jgi:hypothetical protein
MCYFDNRFTRQQAILAYLATVGQPRGTYIGHLPRTGDVVAALGLPKDKRSFASCPGRSLVCARRGRWTATSARCARRAKALIIASRKLILGRNKKE